MFIMCATSDTTTRPIIASKSEALIILVLKFLQIICPGCAVRQTRSNNDYALNAKIKGSFIKVIG